MARVRGSDKTDSLRTHQSTSTSTSLLSSALTISPSPSLRSGFTDLSTPLSNLFKQKSTHDDEVLARDSKEAKHMWSIYEEEAEVTDTQKEGADDGLLAFIGLFSAVVALFIVESYKKLSPDSGVTTTILLTQISQQLAGLQNNTYSRPQETPAFSPTAAILCVNALWFLSLVIAIVSAFYVIQVQQLIRRHTQTLAELPSDQESERVRSYLFLGTQKYKMTHAIEFILLPLHISVFLFLSGLIIFLFTISNAMAIVLTVAVVSVVLPYTFLTILPIADDACPYSTPMSQVSWFLWYTTASVAASVCRWAVERFRYYLKSCGVAGPCAGRLSDWSKILKDNINMNREYLKDGLRGNIFWHTKRAPLDVDLSTLTWLLQRPIMGRNKDKLQEFVDSIPPQIVVQLSHLEAESGKKTIRDHLSKLFQDCLHNEDKLEEPKRSQRLQIYLDDFYQIVKPSSHPDKDPEMILQYVWSNFKDLETVRKLRDHSDPAIRIFSHSICAHLSRNIVRKSKPDDLEQSWLRYFVGKTQADANFDRSKWDDFILESFVFGVFPCVGDVLFVKPEHASCFVETLAVLMKAGNTSAPSKEIFSHQIFSFIEHQWETRERSDVADKLRQCFASLNS